MLFFFLFSKYVSIGNIFEHFDFKLFNISDSFDDVVNEEHISVFGFIIVWIDILFLSCSLSLDIFYYINILNNFLLLNIF